MAVFNGTWEFVESSNLQGLFNELGAFKELPNAGDRFKPTVVVNVNGSELCMKVTMFGSEVERVYELGKEVEEVSIDGRNVRRFMKVDSKKLTYKESDGKTEIFTISEVDGDTTNTVLNVGNVTANMTFQRV